MCFPRFEVGDRTRPQRSAIYEIVTPLSTGYTCAVTIRDSSKARKTERLAKSASNYDPFDLIEAHLVAPAIVELRRARPGMFGMAAAFSTPDG